MVVVKVGIRIRNKGWVGLGVRVRVRLDDMIRDYVVLTQSSH